MKKFVVCLLLFVPFFSDILAQPEAGQHEISVSYGLVSGREITDGLAANGRGEGGIKDTSISGNYFISYRYFITDRIALGGTLGMQRLAGYTKNDYDEVTSRYIMHNTTIAAELTGILHYSKSVQTYVLVGVGPSFPNANVYWGSGGFYNVSNNTRFNFQCSGGIRFGRRLSGFVEAGLGYKGLINFGLSFGLKKSDNTNVDKPGVYRMDAIQR